MCHSQGETDLSTDNRLKRVEITETNDNITNDYLTLFNLDLHGNSEVITTVVLVATILSVLFLYKFYKCCKIRQSNLTVTPNPSDKNNNSPKLIRDPRSAHDSHGRQGT